MKEITAYQCDYCDRIFEHEMQCVIHEDRRCNKNPIHGHCDSCYYDINGILCHVDKEEINQYCTKNKRRHCKYWKPATASNSEEVK